MSPTRTRPPLAESADLELTWLQNAYADWLTTATGYEVDTRSVALAITLRKQFTQSDAYTDAMAQKQNAALQAGVERRNRAKQRILDRAAKFKAKADEILAQAAEMGLTGPVVDPPAPKVDEVAARRATKPTSKASKAAATTAKSIPPRAPRAAKATAKPPAAKSRAASVPIATDGDEPGEDVF